MTADGTQLALSEFAGTGRSTEEILSAHSGGSSQQVRIVKTHVVPAANGNSAVVAATRWSALPVDRSCTPRRAGADRPCYEEASGRTNAAWNWLLLGYTS